MPRTRHYFAPTPDPSQLKKMPEPVDRDQALAIMRDDLQVISDNLQSMARSMEQTAAHLSHIVHTAISQAEDARPTQRSID